MIINKYKHKIEGTLWFLDNIKIKVSSAVPFDECFKTILNYTCSNIVYDDDKTVTFWGDLSNILELENNFGDQIIIENLGLVTDEEQNELFKKFDKERKEHIYKLLNKGE